MDEVNIGGCTHYRAPNVERNQDGVRHDANGAQNAYRAGDNDPSNRRFHIQRNLWFVKGKKRSSKLKPVTVLQVRTASSAVPVMLILMSCDTKSNAGMSHFAFRCDHNNFVVSSNSPENEYHKGTHWSCSVAIAWIPTKVIVLISTMVESFSQLDH